MLWSIEGFYLFSLWKLSVVDELLGSIGIIMCFVSDSFFFFFFAFYPIKLSSFVYGKNKRISFGFRTILWRQRFLEPVEVVAYLRQSVKIY